MQNITTIKFDNSKSISIFRPYLPALYFDSNFFRQHFPPPPCVFLKLIKCVELCNFMSKSAPSSECSTNFYSIRHDLTQSDLYTIYIVESPHNLKLHVDSWSLMSKLVKATFFPSLSLYPYIWKLFKESFDKCRQNSPQLL